MQIILLTFFVLKFNFIKKDAEKLIHSGKVNMKESLLLLAILYMRKKLEWNSNIMSNLRGHHFYWSFIWNIYQCLWVVHMIRSTKLEWKIACSQNFYVSSPKLFWNDLFFLKTCWKISLKGKQWNLIWFLTWFFQDLKSHHMRSRRIIIVMKKEEILKNKIHVSDLKG
jgi:hypothetical protein